MSAATSSVSGAPRILVLGGGSLGLYAARRLSKKLGRGARITLVDANPYMTYLPFLPETASGAISGRDVVAPFTRALPGVEAIQAKVTKIDHAAKTVTVQPSEGDAFGVSYDEVVVALGSVSRTLPIPGVAEFAVGFKSVEEAVALRDRVLDNIFTAAHTKDEALRRRLLTFTFIGGGFAGIEAIAEVEDMARAAVRKLPTLTESDLKFVVIEAMGRILPELPLDLALYGLANLRARGIEVHLETFLSGCVDGHVTTSTGLEFESDIVVWTAGVKANPVVTESDLPTDKLGRLTVSATLQVVDEDGNVVPGAWGGGDTAAVPDLAADEEGKFCPPNAQHATREGVVLAENLIATLRGGAVREYRHKNLGVVASLGLHKGVANLLGAIKLKGWFAWATHRAYHVYAMPTPSRKVRILAGWLSASVLRRELVSLSATENPDAGFRAVATPAKPKEESKG